MQKKQIRRLIEAIREGMAIWGYHPECQARINELKKELGLKNDQPITRESKPYKQILKESTGRCG